MTDRRQLPKPGTTKVVDGVTFTATATQWPEDLVEWDGGPRGGKVHENAVVHVSGRTPYRYWTPGMSGETFPPIARHNIAQRRRAYEKAKAEVEAYEASV